MARIKQIKKAASEDDIEIGDQVKHAKFGTGTVLYKSGSGDRAKAIVVFPEEGQKKLLLKYAKMKKIKETKPSEEATEQLREEEIIQALEDSVATKKRKRRKSAEETDEEAGGEMDKDEESDEDDEESDEEHEEGTEEDFNE
jgi:uncharacterized membrane protein YukC